MSSIDNEKLVVRFFAVAACAILGAILLWLPPQAVEFSGYAALSQHAETVVDEVTAQNLAAFAAISAIKTALAIIEDTTVGVGIQVQLGDAVEAVYDYVNFVWEALLYSLLVLSAYKMLIETQILHLGLQLVGVGLLLWSASVALPRAPHRLSLLAQRTLFAGVLFAYLVPAALLIMHFATVHYTGPLKEKQAQRINELRTEVDSLRTQFSEIKGSIDVLHPLDTAAAVRDKIVQIAASLTRSVGQSAQAMLYYVVIVLFELLIFPVISAYLLIKLLNVCFGRIIERSPLSLTRTPPSASPAEPRMV